MYPHEPLLGADSYTHLWLSISFNHVFGIKETMFSYKVGPPSVYILIYSSIQL